MVKIIFKHGGEILLKCRNFSIIEYGNATTGYDINGIGGDYPLYICTEQIAAVIYIKESEEKCL